MNTNKKLYDNIVNINQGSLDYNGQVFSSSEKKRAITSMKNGFKDDDKVFTMDGEHIVDNKMNEYDDNWRIYNMFRKGEYSGIELYIQLEGLLLRNESKEIQLVEDHILNFIEGRNRSVKIKEMWRSDLDNRVKNWNSRRKTLSKLIERLG